MLANSDDLHSISQRQIAGRVHFLALSGSNGARFLIKPTFLQMVIAVVQTMAYTFALAYCSPPGKAMAVGH